MFSLSTMHYVVLMTPKEGETAVLCQACWYLSLDMSKYLSRVSQFTNMIIIKIYISLIYSCNYMYGITAQISFFSVHIWKVSSNNWSYLNTNAGSHTRSTTSSLKSSASFVHPFAKSKGKTLTREDRNHPIFISTCWNLANKRDPCIEFTMHIKPCQQLPIKLQFVTS